MKVPTLRELAPVAGGFLTGLALGALVGLYGVRAATMYSGLTNSMGTNFTLSTRAHTQYCNADYDGARAALLAWLRHLDAQKPPSEAGTSAKIAQWKDYSETRIRTFVDDPKYCKGLEPESLKPKVQSPKP